MTIMLTAIALLAHTDSSDISSYLQTNIEDLSFTVRVVQSDQSELAKVNKDFGASYRFESTKVKLKEPFMLRLDSSVDNTAAEYIFNGSHRTILVRRAHIKLQENLQHSPGKRQTIFDFGLLTPSVFQSLYKAVYVRHDRATGYPVFDVTYRSDDNSRSRIWIDPQRHIIWKREWYNQEGRQLATFLYERPAQIGGVWIPTRVTVKNTDDVIGGVTAYESIKVNSGLEDSIFKS
ncbi:MAG: outer membrane lipoprotein-sorting protein [Armatimonadetes bacterium]|nr:outer membrane lipoprotein-sorting protein [Armatimonadota bacterium]